MIRKLPNGATFYSDIDDVAVPHEAQTPKRISLKRVAIPVSLKGKDYLKKKGICCSEHFLSKDTNNKKELKVSDVMPDVHFPSREETGADAEDHQVLGSLANKISASEKIKTFKTEAHKRQAWLILGLFKAGGVGDDMNNECDSYNIGECDNTNGGGNASRKCADDGSKKCWW